MLDLTIPIIHLQANSPVKKAVKKPRVSGPKLIASEKIFPSKRSLATFPKIKGTTIRNENFAEDVLSNPKITDVAIVAPDLEIPGKIAIAWAIPIRKLCEVVITLLVGFALSAKKRSIPVIISIKPTKNNLPSKRVSIISLKKMPTKAAGIIETIIFNAKLLSSFDFVEKMPLIILSISFLKMKIVLNAVAKCNTTVIIRLSLGLKSVENIPFTISRCPLLLTGKNSVRPCTIPKTRAIK